jgi:hypothetical protein
MIGILESGPVVLCDQCGLRIADAKDGSYYWAPGEESVTEVFFAHKRCDAAFQQEHPTDDDLMWFSGELVDFPIFLGDNLSLNWGDARKHARVTRMTR